MRAVTSSVIRNVADIVFRPGMDKAAASWVAPAQR